MFQSVEKRLIWAISLVLAGVFFSALTGLIATQDTGRVASIWSANAIVLAALLLSNRRQWFVILACGFTANIMANLIIGDRWQVASGLAFCNMLEAGTGAILMHRFCGEDLSTISRKWLVQLTLLGGVVACTVSAVCVGFVLSPNLVDYDNNLSVYFPAHLIGVITVVPVIIAIAKNDGALHDAKLARSLMIVALWSVLASLLIFSQSLPITFLIFPVLTWSAFKAGVPGATISLFIFTLVATSLTIRGYGPIMLMEGTDHSRVLFLQVLIMIAIFSTLPVAMLLADRQGSALRLAEARDAAVGATLAKSRFLANMSHEIRTPLNGIIGFVDLLATSPLSSEQRRQIDMVASSSDALLALLNDILDLSKIDANQLKIVDGPTDIAALTQECVTLVKPAAEAKGLTLTIESDATAPCHILTDSLRVRQILLNLLGNAVKFTSHGSVGVTIRRVEGRLDITVFDSGCGIPTDRQAHIFDEFEQESDDTAHQYGGTGLGLSISRRLAILMGGDLQLESERGRGTRISLMLPYVPAVVAPQDIADNATVEGAMPSFAYPHYILIADDVDINREVIGGMLTKMGARVDYATNGKEAADKVLCNDLTADNYDLVLMDQRMPVMSGIEAVNMIRSNGIEAKDLPILALTANVMDEDIEKSLANGMQAVVAKPLKLVELHRAVTAFAGQRSARLLPPYLNESEVKPQENYEQRKARALEEIRHLLARDELRGMDLDAIENLAHSLAGTAGFFGEALFGDRAADLENAVRESRSTDEIRKKANALRNAA